MKKILFLILIILITFLTVSCINLEKKTTLKFIFKGSVFSKTSRTAYDSLWNTLKVEILDSENNSAGMFTKTKDEVESSNYIVEDVIKMNSTGTFTFIISIYNSSTPDKILAKTSVQQTISENINTIEASLEFENGDIFINPKTSSNFSYKVTIKRLSDDTNIEEKNVTITQEGHVFSDVSAGSYELQVDVYFNETLMGSFENVYSIEVYPGEQTEFNFDDILFTPACKIINSKFDTKQYGA